MYNQLQLRELFHLEFLRWLTRKVKPACYALKGGSNLRFFYKSARYSEDMDMDIQDIEVDSLKEIVMNILKNTSFQDIFKSFGIDRIVAPDILKTKQTQTTQRFKVHLVTSAGEDLFTKIEFSRRGFKGNKKVESISESLLRQYRLAPLMVSHYDAASAAFQKLGALSDRAATQARDIFDLYVLGPQCGDIASLKPVAAPSKDILEKARENLFQVSFEQFKDTVVSYLSEEDRSLYGASDLWDEIKIKVSDFIEQLRS